MVTILRTREEVVHASLNERDSRELGGTSLAPDLIIVIVTVQVITRIVDGFVVGNDNIVLVQGVVEKQEISEAEVVAICPTLIIDDVLSGISPTSRIANGEVLVSCKCRKRRATEEYNDK